MRSQVSETHAGWLLFAAVMIFIAGFHDIIYGVASLNDYNYVVRNAGGGFVIYQDLTYWGWLLVALGGIQIIAAGGIMTRNQAARWFAIAVATLNIVAQLAFLSIFPVWSVVLIALDVLVIYALATYGTRPGPGPATEPYPEADRAYAERERERQRGRADYAGTSTETSAETPRPGSQMPPPPPTTGPTA